MIASTARNLLTEGNTDWLAAVGVGSEDLYRKEMDVGTLIWKINDVRSMLQHEGNYRETKIGHVDVWDVWTHNHDLIRACDFIGFNGFPYFEEGAWNSIEKNGELLWAGVGSLRDSVRDAGAHAEVWITETGFPHRGLTVNVVCHPLPCLTLHMLRFSS